jgi:hypothetical protein
MAYVILQGLTPVHMTLAVLAAMVTVLLPV